MRDKNRNADMIIYVLLAALMTIVWHFASGTAYNRGEAKLPVNFNLLLYVGAILGVCILAVIFFLISDFFAGRISEEGPVSRFFNIVLIPALVLAACFVLFMIYQVYENENALFPGQAADYSLRQFFPHSAYFAFILVPAIMFYIGAGKNAGKEAGRLVRFAAALTISALSAVYTWCPNPFGDNGGGILHIDAYTTTIINAARSVPYDSHHICIYGHHGILYRPLVHLLGNDYRAVLFSIAVFAFLTFMAACYTADVLIERDSIYLLTVACICATTTLLTRRGVYYQINPHRLMFPVFGTACIAWECRHPAEKFSLFRLFFRIVVSIIAYVWNFETGFFTTAVFAFDIFLKVHYEESWISLRTLRTILLLILFVSGTFAAAVGVVNLYNAALGGGPVSFRQFVYPLFSGTYNVNNLRMPIPSVGHLYYLQIMLFGFTILSVLRGRMTAPPERKNIDILSAAVGLSGFASLIYFINRPAYGNMSIAFIQMALLLGRGTDTFIDRGMLFSGGIKAHRVFKYALGAVMFFALFWISAEGVLYVANGLNIRRESGWNTSEAASEISSIRDEVPEDTFAVGMGIPQLYYQLGWNPQIYPTDYPDMNKENWRFVKERIIEEDAVFTSDPKIVPEGYVLRESYSIGRVEFGYYEKLKTE